MNFRISLRLPDDPHLMLYYVGSFLLLIWLIEKFLLHKGGFIHTLLFAAIGCFVAQLVQRLRTREYERFSGEKPPGN